MEVWHHIALNVLTDPELLAAIEKLQLDHRRTPAPGPGSVLVSLDVSESDPRWRSLQPHIGGALDIAHTLFTTEEILAAEWVRLIPAFQRGYPQPESTWVENPTNFRQLCPKCGMEIQEAPFRIKGEPNMRKHDFMSLIWTWSLFATRRVIRDFQKAGFTGFEPWDVFVNAKGKKSEVIQQVHVSSAAEPAYLEERTNAVRCEQCGTIKHKPHRVGPMLFRADAFAGVSADFLLTGDWFGDGKAAFREILISHRVAEHILTHELKGVVLQATKLERTLLS